MPTKFCLSQNKGKKTLSKGRKKKFNKRITCDMRHVTPNK